ncbi:MAG: MATE family efflux transporter [Wenzhouxiangellaceae bacterium]
MTEQIVASRPVRVTPWARRRALWRIALRGEERNYTRGPIKRAVFLLAVPMILEMAMESVFAVVDIFFVSRLGADAVSAVGLTEAVATLLYAVAIGISMAATAMVARRIGEGNAEGAAVATAQVLWSGLLASALVGGAGIFYGHEILALMGAEQSVIDNGVGYTQILLGGSITIMYLFLINAVFRGAGDATIAMRSLWLANGINIVLDPILIFGLGPFPEMGVAGAALATTIGRGTGVLYQLWRLFGDQGRLALKLRHLALKLDVMRRLLRLSAGGVMQFIIATSAWIGLMRIVAPFGSEAVAGYTIAVRIIIFTILPAWGLGNAAATLVGQNLGAGQPLRAERSAWLAARYNVYFMFCVSILFIALPHLLIGIFTDAPEVIRHGVDSLRIISYGYVFFAIGMVLVQSLNGAGDTDTPTVINFFCYWVIQIPLAWWLATGLDFGPRGVFWAVTIAESLLAVVAIWVFRRGRWKLREV